jgi:hypothetical protein
MPWHHFPTLQMQKNPEKTGVNLAVVSYYEFFDQGVKPALGKTIRGKTITCGKTIAQVSGYLQTSIFIKMDIPSPTSSRFY